MGFWGFLYKISPALITRICFLWIATTAFPVIAIGQAPPPADLKVCDETMDPSTPGYATICSGQNRLATDTVQGAEDKKQLLEDQANAEIDTCDGQGCTLNLAGDHYFRSGNAERTQAIENILNSDGLTVDATNYYNMALRYIALVDQADLDMTADPTIANDPYPLPGQVGAAGPAEPRTGAATDAIFMREVNDELGTVFFNNVTYDTFVNVKGIALVEFAASLGEASIQAADQFNNLAQQNNDTADEINDLNSDVGQRTASLNSLGAENANPLGLQVDLASDADTNFSAEADQIANDADNSGASIVEYGGEAAGSTKPYRIGAEFRAQTNANGPDTENADAEGADNESENSAEEGLNLAENGKKSEEVQGMIDKSKTAIDKFQDDFKKAGLADRTDGKLNVELGSLSAEQRAQITKLESELQSVASKRKAEFDARLEESSKKGASLLAGGTKNKNRKELKAQDSKRLAELRHRAEDLRKKLLAKGLKPGDLRKQAMEKREAASLVSDEMDAEFQTKNSNDLEGEYDSPFDRSLFERVSIRIENYERKSGVGMNYLID